MSRDTKFWQKWSILGGLLSVAMLGCSPSTLGFLFRDTTKPPPQALEPRPDKKEVTVLVMVNSSPTLSMDFAGSDREIATLTGRKIEEGAVKAKVKHPLKVIDPSKLDKLRNSPGFDARSPASVGKQLGADYVLDVTVSTMTMTPAQYGGEYYEGEANVAVVVYDTANPETIYKQYGVNPKVPLKGTASITPLMYRRMLIDRIATELSWQHIPHEQEGIGSMR